MIVANTLTNKKVWKFPAVSDKISYKILFVQTSCRTLLYFGVSWSANCLYCIVWSSYLLVGLVCDSLANSKLVGSM